jgi:ligand-binding sensor domain-containing protein/DNA-binding CsgD family transcriptional regulator
MNKTLVISITFWISLLATNEIVAQSNIGMPIIKNYLKEAYQGGLQTWEIQQDKSGKLYFANNDGLLIFDGTNWQKVNVGNSTIVRSLLVDEERIYAGSQGDFGYFKPDSKGMLQYFSLKKLLKAEDQNFADVWDIVAFQGDIYIRTTNKIFKYAPEKETIQLIDSAKRFEYLTKVNASIYFHSDEDGLVKITKSKPKVLANTAALKKSIVTTVEALNDSTLIISTLKDGIFRYSKGKLDKWRINPIIEQNRINSIVKINENELAIGTLSGGLFIVDLSGRIMRQIEAGHGLQSNDILDILKDGNGNLWLALSNGIDYVEINSPFSIIEPDGNSRGTGYDVKIHDNHIYFGTSNGLYVADWKMYYNPFEDRQFELIDNTKGQVWSLDIHKDELLLGHHEGTFRINQRQATKLSSLPGSWTSIPLNRYDNYLLEGNYNGLNLYEFKDNHWQFQQKIEDMIDESSRIMTQDAAGNIWIGHPYRGVYKVRLDVEGKRVQDIKLYNSKDGFPSDYILVFKVGDAVVFASDSGIYEYNKQEDKFEPSQKWLEFIDSTSRVQLLVEDAEENIWFVIDNEVGVFWSKDLGVEKQLEKQLFPQLNNRLVGGFELIYPFDKENVFFPLERGFMHFNPKKYYQEDTRFNVHLRHVMLGDSNIIFGGWLGDAWQVPKFKAYQNSFVFTYGASDYSNLQQTTYQYYLEGLEKQWSYWTTKTVKEYTNLNPGTYTFKIRAKNANGQVSEIRSFEFVIAPPWYSSLAARVLYLVIGIAFLIGLIFIPRRQFEQEKAILKEAQEKTLQEKAAEHQKILRRNEAEISKLQRDKLESEIQFKNQELAITTMNLVQKGEFLLKLKEELTKILNDTREPKTKKDIRRTIKLLNQNAELDRDWEQFAQHFDQVHEDFLKRLRENYPQLTPKDQRLCTYLKMNLSTKEIAPLMNISVRGVEISRYRLRKKLDLPTETNLNEFMMNF